MRAVNVTLDLVSIAISLVLIYPLAFGKGKRNSMRVFFILMCVFNLGISLGDIPAWVCEGFARPWYPFILQVGTIIFWGFCGPLLLCFTGYLISYLKLKVKVNRLFWYLDAAIVISHVVCSIASIWNGMFYTITPENTYMRGWIFWLSQLIPFLSYALDVAIFVTYRKKLSHKDIRILSSYIVLPALSLAIQAVHFGVALINIGVVFSLLLIYINVQSEQELRLERQEKELAEGRIDIMLSQIQPHFLYNALTTIRQLCDADPKQAKEAIRDFSLFLRGNMDSLKSKAPIPFEQELSHVENYLALERQRFQGRLRTVYDIRCRDFSIPPLTLQPIVENAVRHGVLKREEGGTVTIRTEETDAAYLVVVSDDGVGIQPQTDADDGHMHIGIENVQGRLSILCGGTIALQSETGVGTTATITIPKEEKTP